MNASSRPAANHVRLLSHGRRVLFLLLALSIVACASTQQGKVYQSIETCNATAQSLTRAFGVLYQQHKAEDPTLWSDRYDKAQAAYASYQKIALAAVDVAAAGGDSMTLALASVNAALTELTTLLASFGVK